MHSDKKKLIMVGLFAAIIGLAAFLRLFGVNWDQGFLLHPDERFVTMVSNAMKIPPSIPDYLDPNVSTMNPKNISFPFFVYGTFPIIVVKFLSVWNNMDTYNSTVILGRIVSAVMDILVIFFIYKTVQLLEKKYKFSWQVKYWSSFFYAIAVLPIQLSHFFAVDTFVNLFTFACFYYALAFHFKPSWKNLFLSALFFGLAFASKISILYVFPVIGIFFVTSVPKMALHYKKHSKDILIYMGYGAAFVVLAYVTARIANPYLFETANFFDLSLSKNWLSNLTQLKSFEAKDAWFPPSTQWIHKPPVTFALYNLAVFGVGIAYFAAFITGLVITIKKYRKLELMFIIAWMIMFFLYQSTTAFKTIRYFIFMYPFMAIFAGITVAYFMELKNKRVGRSIAIAIAVFSFIWPLAFMSIYTKHHSRVTASEWIYKNIPNGSKILGEHWDDQLPLFLPGEVNQYPTEQLTMYDPDTPEKWDKINSILNSADYYVLSSNRQWGSIPTVPERYPISTKFYEDLFANRTSYKFVTKIASYPSLRYLGIPIDFNDSSSEESFTVYDHPEVYIFKKTDDKN